MDDDKEEVQKNRLKKVQEKNKRAQARYRQKQKEKMQTFEEQCQRLTEELQGTAAAYKKLERDKLALEAELRELRVAAATVPAGKDEVPSQAQPSVHSAQPVQVHCPVSYVPVGPVGWERLPGSEAHWNRFMRAIVSKQLGEDQAKEADVHPFEWKCPDEILAIYTGLIEELNARLVRLEREPSQEANKSICELIHAMRTMGKTYEEGLSKQQRVEGGTGLTQIITAAHGPSQPDLWHHVLAAARVSPGQRDRVLDLRAAHLQKMEDTIRNRKDIVWELQQATVMPDSASQRQAAFAKAVQLSKQLQDSLAAEHLAKEEFFRAVCHQVLNETQEARMLVTAFPYLVDVPTICDLLASEPEAATTDSEETEEPFRSNALPAILQIPAVVDSDLTPDLYMHAFAWGCDPATRQAFAGPSKGKFAHGGQGSGFAPPQYLRRPANANPIMNPNSNPNSKQ